MADCSTFEDGGLAVEAGADFVATTLSGYTAATRSRDAPDFELIRRLRTLDVPVVAEGHIRRPQQAAKAREAGAHVVTVGSAITRPELITEWFVDAMKGVERRDLDEQTMTETSLSE
jgi:N-acylglucosamine-6-phosphate 2-epimerase